MEEIIDFDREDDFGGDGDQPRRKLMSEAEKQLIIDEITAACSSLGCMDINDGTYMKDRDCKACLKEIIRLLNSDNCQHIARQTLGSLNIVRTDLIPLINQYCDFNDGDTDLFNLVIRLCTNLTSSVFLLFENQEVPASDPEMMKVYNKLLSALYGYKGAFANDRKIWKMLNTHLWHTDDEVPFERLLILLRNVLHIPVDSAADLGIHSDFDTHSQCLYRMEHGGLFDTIIKIASETQRGTEFCFHIIEIVHLMLRDQNPATVAMCKLNNNKRKLDEDDPDKKRLAEISARDARERLAASARFAQPRFRHSLFVIKNCQSLGSNALLTTNLVGKSQNINLDRGKTELRKSKNKKPLSSEASSIVISDGNTKPSQVTYKLKVFSKLFVEKVYANYMQQIKHNLIQKKAAENDESYYLWAIQYFTAFNRLLYMSLDNVSETLSTSTLHFIQILISTYVDKIKLEKKRSQVEKISKRLHLALRAYREILNLIKSIKQDSEFWNTIEKIKKNVFTELEYNSLLLSLFQQYDESKHCPEYLKDLISTNDIFLDLLEEYSNTHDPIQMADSEDDSDTEENLLRDVLTPEGDQQADQEPRQEPQPDQPNPLDPLDQPDQLDQPDLLDQPDQLGQPERADKADKTADKATKPKEKKKKKKKKGRRKKSKKDLRAVHFMSRYCSPDVVKAHLEVLRDFKRNDSALNLQILKFFKRVVYECKSEVMLMQASVFSCLLEILDYHSSLPGRDEFVALTKHLMTVYGDMARKKRWMIQELLFWKTHNDIIEIETAVDPPRMATPPVAPSSPPLRSVSAELPLGEERMSQDDDAAAEQLHEQRHVDSLEELMAELGSDSSPDVSDNEDFVDSDREANSNNATSNNAGSHGNGIGAGGLVGDGGDDDHPEMEAAGDNDDDDDVDDDDPIAMPSQQQVSSSRRARLLSSSSESGASDEAVAAAPARKGAGLDLFPSDSDDLSAPPSPIPSPSPELGGAGVSDLPVAATSEDGE